MHWSPLNEYLPNNEDQDVMLYNAAVHQVMYCWLRLKQYPGTEESFNYKFYHIDIFNEPERERERERETDRQTDRGTETDKQRERETERELSW